MNREYCSNEECDGLVLGGICNQCGAMWQSEGNTSTMIDTSIRVCGLSIKVREVNLSGGHFGQASLEDSEILINKDMAEDLKRDTLMHEVIHIISGCNALGITEEQTACLSNNLVQVLGDNKHVW